MASGYSDLSEISGSGYGAQQKPPKINLLDEKPRRESVVEQQLSAQIVRPPQEFAPQTHLASAPASFSDYVASSATSRTSAHPQEQISAARANVRPQQLAPPPPTSANREAAYSALVSDLRLRDEQLRREIAHMNQYNLSPWARPRTVRDPRREPAARVTRDEQRWTREVPAVSASSSRPGSRASSTRSNTEAELMERAARLMQDAEELERKPIRTQQVLVESGATGSSPEPPPSGSGIQTAIIRVPRGEVDNKSPLPFAYDNFSTLGVRGNIASVGAAEPEKPYAPIFPVVKRTPSPSARR